MGGAGDQRLRHLHSELPARATRDARGEAPDRLRWSPCRTRPRGTHRPRVGNCLPSSRAPAARATGQAEIAADESTKAKLLLGGDPEPKAKEVADLTVVLKARDEKLAEPRKRRPMRSARSTIWRTPGGR